ncbi:MAG TPA: hypothetical protein VKD71_07250 [Gemmataceae bacterium]|nr:hypothetical protein [Gemmataceae bacterium]
MDRLHRLEDELAELRHTLSELAGIVVGDIRERREAAQAAGDTIPDLPVPVSVVPGGQPTKNAAKALRRPWLLTEFFREVGTALRMYMHPRYQVRRSTQIMVPLILVLFGLNYLVFNYTLLDVPVLRQILERVVDIILAVLLYKVVSREVVRFRQTEVYLAGLPRSWGPTPMSLLHNDPETAAVTRHESP